MLFLMFYSNTTATAQGQLEKDILAEINLMRTNPKGYIAIIDKIKNNGWKFSSGKYLDFKTENPNSAYTEVVNFLNKKSPLSPLLWNECIYDAAKAHVDDHAKVNLQMDCSNSRGHTSAAGVNLERRILKYCQFAGKGKIMGGVQGENGSFAHTSLKEPARSFVFRWLFDIGAPIRGHRHCMFHQEDKYAAVASSISQDGKIKYVFVNTGRDDDISRHALENSSTNTYWISDLSNELGNTLTINSKNPSSGATYEAKLMKENDENIQIFTVKKIGQNAIGRLEYEISFTDSKSNKFCLEAQSSEIICKPCTQKANQTWYISEAVKTTGGRGISSFLPKSNVLIGMAGQQKDGKVNLGDRLSHYYLVKKEKIGKEVPTDKPVKISKHGGTFYSDTPCRLETKNGKVKMNCDKNSGDFLITYKGTSSNIKYYEISSTENGNKQCLFLTGSYPREDIAWKACDGSSKSYWSFIPQYKTQKTVYQIVPKGEGTGGSALQIYSSGVSLANYNKNESFQIFSIQ